MIKRTLLVENKTVDNTLPSLNPDRLIGSVGCSGVTMAKALETALWQVGMMRHGFESLSHPGKSLSHLIESHLSYPKENLSYLITASVHIASSATTMNCCCIITANKL